MSANAWVGLLFVLIVVYAAICDTKRRNRRHRRKKLRNPRSFRHRIGPRLATARQKKYVYRRDGGRCVYCPDRRKVHYRSSAHRRGPWTSCDDCVEFDHDIPHSRGGLTTVDNLVVSCFACNREKGTMTGDEYRAYKARQLRSIRRP